MTRFARGDGSKASNKRTYEEATSWEEMKSDLSKAVSKKKSKELSKKDISKEEKIKPTENLDENLKKKSKKLSKKSATIEDAETAKVLNSEKDEGIVNDDDAPKEMINNEIADVNSSEKTERKKKKKLSLEEKKNNYVIEDGIKYKIFKNGKKKPWFDLPYGESEIMTKYKNCFVKREDVVELEKYRTALEAEGFTPKEITNKMLNQERKAHNKLRVELLREQIGSEKQTERKQSKETQKTKITTAPIEQDDSSIYASQKMDDLTFEENDMMTQYDGFWIMKKNVDRLNKIKVVKKQRILNKRNCSNLNDDLTPEETIEFGRLMKKEKRREFRMLKLALIQMAKENKKRQRPTDVPRAKKKKKPGKYLGIEYKEDSETVRFGVYFIKKEAADRLRALKKSLISKGCTEEEIRQMMKRECRKEERVLKNERKLFCFRCRQVGHMVSTCPNNNEDGTQGVEICFKCGSTEHMARACSSNKGGSYSHANCFICGEVGHISRECPDNPKGLYPNGGCCNECGSVEHLKKDCPEFLSRVEDHTIKASRFRPNMEIESMDCEEPSKKDEEPVKRSKRAKIIKFDD